LERAIQLGADVFISADFKYHDYFRAEGKIQIIDIGHFESEQFTCELLAEIIQEIIPTFAVHLTENNTNPVNYI
jgi:putative NIF3 family GTP cyclohydrolase 1 type 2